MPQKSDSAARARAEALFKRRQEQARDAPIAMAEYRAAERAKYERMRELREMRLARDARLAREGATAGPTGGGPARTSSRT